MFKNIKYFINYKIRVKFHFINLTQDRKVEFILKQLLYLNLTKSLYSFDFGNLVALNEQLNTLQKVSTSDVNVLFV